MTSGVELAANTVATASILLAGRNSVHTWWTGIVGCALFSVVFFEARLYADVVLQAFFIATSAIGWWQWLHGDHRRPLPIARVTSMQLLGCAVGGVVAALAYGALLANFTDAYAPFVDSGVLSLSVIAQLLLMKRRIDTWPFWLAVNSIAVPLYASRGLHLTAFLYAVYWINALVAWRHWHGLIKVSLRREAAAAPT